VALSPGLALALLVVLPVLMAVMLLLARRTRLAAQAWAIASREYAAEAHRMLRALTLTRVHAAEQHQRDRSGARAQRLADDTRLFGRARASHSAVQNALGAVAGSLVLVLGGIAVADGHVTLGSLLGFYAVLALLLRQLQAIGHSTNDVVLGLEAIERVEQFLALPSEDPYEGGERTIAFSGSIVLEDVEFGYDGEPVVRDVSLAFGAGERVAVIGPNGAGKSTLVSLVMGVHRPQRGRLLADGAPYEELDMRAFRRQVGVVLQDPVILPGTIRDNIAFGRTAATDAEVRTAAELATAAAFIDRLPDGYDTELGDEGVGLSGGQRQRIAIARALLAEPALLLLDEPTTYLDDEAVLELIDNLDRLPRAPTVVLVTHDPHAAGQADRVIELRGGRVVADAAAAP
jgi:ABC-type multidrug transport system fused ATPase/permease subunit